MLIVEFDGPSSWCLDVSETGESTERLMGKCVERHGRCPVTSTLLTHRIYPWEFGTPLSLAHIKSPRWQPLRLNDRHLQSHR